MGRILDSNFRERKVRVVREDAQHWVSRPMVPHHIKQVGLQVPVGSIVMSELLTDLLKRRTHHWNSPCSTGAQRWAIRSAIRRALE